MTSAFIVGCGVAGAAYALKGVIHVGGRVAQNEAAMKQAAALGAGIRGAGGVFKMPSFLSFTKHAGGFDAAINRREAALILNCRHVLPTPSSFCTRAHGPPTPPPRRESAMSQLRDAFFVPIPPLTPVSVSWIVRDGRPFFLTGKLRRAAY